MEWQAIGAMIGAVTGPLGLLIAAFALYVSWRNYRRQADADLPLVSADVYPERGHWWQATITVENRSGVAWSANKVTVRRPRGAKIARYRIAYQIGGRPFKPPDPSTLSNDVGTSFVVGAGDRHSELLLLFVPPTWWDARKLSIRLVLSSNEAQPRRIIKEITRTLIEAKSAAA